MDPLLGVRSAGPVRGTQIYFNGVAPAYGIATIDLAGLTSYTPTSDELRCPVLKLTGTLTAGVAITLPLAIDTSASGPQSVNRWTIINDTSGAFTVTIGGPTGATCTITQGKTAEVFADQSGFWKWFEA